MTELDRTFQALADELEVPMPPLLDLRDRAGWSADKASKLPKMSALVAEALVPRPPQKTMDVASEGVCLILSNDATGTGVAEQLVLIAATSVDAFRGIHR